MADNFEKASQQLSKQMNLKKAQIQKTPILQPREKQELKQEVQEFQEKLDELNQLIEQYEKNNAKYNLTQNQITNRKQEYQRLVGLKNDIMNLIDNPNQMRQDLFGKQAEPKTFQNTVAQPGATNKQIKQGYDDLKKDTDKQIDGLINNVQITKHVAIKMHDELENHIEQLDEIEQNVDKNTNNMITTTGKMKKLISESSTCGILVTIFVEIAVLVLVIIYV